MPEIGFRPASWEQKSAIWPASARGWPHGLLVVVRRPDPMVLLGLTWLDRGVPVALCHKLATMPATAPSSSQVQDTRFSSWEQGFESPWGHTGRGSFTGTAPDFLHSSP